MTFEAFKSCTLAICKSLSGMDFSDGDLASQVESKHPYSGEEQQKMANLMKEGLRDSWLCDRENGHLKFSRVFKPTDETYQFSCDAVYMPDCAGPRHTHPKGELSFCVPLEGEPIFEGCQEGWAYLKPGSTHTPTVSGGSMVIIYFLPDGEMVWES